PHRGHGHGPGLGWRAALLRAVRLPHHRHPARDAPEGALLSQLLRPPGPAHLPALLRGAHRGVRDRPAHRGQAAARPRAPALAVGVPGELDGPVRRGGLHLRPLLVARRRGAVLCHLAVPGARVAGARLCDAVRRPDRRCATESGAPPRARRRSRGGLRVHDLPLRRAGDGRARRVGAARAGDRARARRGPQDAGVGWAAAVHRPAAMTRGYPRIEVMPQVAGYSVLALVSLVLVVCGVLAEARGAGGLLGPGWLRALGKYSYAMYIFHTLLHHGVGVPLLARLQL